MSLVSNLVIIIVQWDVLWNETVNEHKKQQPRKMTSVESSFDAMAIVQEMIVCLNNAEEPKLVAEIREKQSELRRLHDKQQQELKDIVSGMFILYHLNTNANEYLSI